MCLCGFWLRCTYSFLGVVSRVPQSGGRKGWAPVPFCSVPSYVPGWMVSHHRAVLTGVFCSGGAVCPSVGRVFGMA